MSKPPFCVLLCTAYSQTLLDDILPFPIGSKVVCLGRMLFIEAYGRKNGH